MRANHIDMTRMNPNVNQPTDFYKKKKCRRKNNNSKFFCLFSNRHIQTAMFGSFNENFSNISSNQRRQKQKFFFCLTRKFIYYIWLHAVDVNVSVEAMNWLANAVTGSMNSNLFWCDDFKFFHATTNFIATSPSMRKAFFYFLLFLCLDGHPTTMASEEKSETNKYWLASVVGCHKSFWIKWWEC